MTKYNRDGRKLSYFIPEWDDKVDSQYDYRIDEALEGSEKVYAHEIYDKPNYDGILASWAKLKENKQKMEDIQNIGIHNYLKFNGPIFGDCGAFSYVAERSPPVDSTYMAEFYNKVGLDFGVSVDHLCIPKFADQYDERKELTIKNAETFLNLHESKGYDFVPVGAAQGWDVASYRDSVEQLLDMGYDYIALGGLTRSQTTEIIEILEGIEPAIKGKSVDLHLFGVARPEAIRYFMQRGVTSIDSASPLRSAWLGSDKNYRDEYYRGYASIRIPYLSKDKKYSALSVETRKSWEDNLYGLLMRFDQGEIEIEEVFSAFKSLETVFKVKAQPKLMRQYYQTLKDRPWERCECTVCRNTGINVMIFRGNNRNRRRGFHNTWQFYRMLQRVLADDKFDLEKYGKEGDLKFPKDLPADFDLW